MKQCKNCILNTICSYYDKLAHEETGWCPDFERKYRRQKLRAAWSLLLIAALLLCGCSPGKHHGHIYIHDPNHFEAVFDRPMSMSVDRDGIKVEASSLKPGFFEDILKFLLLTPR